LIGCDALQVRRITAALQKAYDVPQAEKQMGNIGLTE
jgi:hypothetical protein